MKKTLGLALVIAGSTLACSAYAESSGQTVGASQSATSQSSIQANFSADPRLGDQVDKICFPSTANRFAVTGEDTVILRVSAKDHYILETRAGCRSLERARQVSIKEAGCTRKGDKLYVSEDLFPRQGLMNRENDRTTRKSLLNSENKLRSNACRIEAIYEWNPETVQQDASLSKTSQDG